MNRTSTNCCIGCRSYQKCRVCRFENDVTCIRWKLEWLLRSAWKRLRRK